MPGAQHRRRVGTVRPSHLMFTGGVGALIDLPNFPVLVRGLDDWRFDTVPDWVPLVEPRLLAAVGKLLSAPVTQLRPPPWLDGFDTDPKGQAARVGVPVIPFPQWLRCTACNRLAPLDSGNWGFVNDKARRPDEARFFHQDCPRRRRQPLAVAARFVLACVDGHLDDFPYREFVHSGGACPAVSHPQLQMEDYGGNRGANVVIRCPSCGAKRNISRAIGQRGAENLPACRGRHPHLSTFGECHRPPMVLVVGASNQWFAQTLSAPAVPQVGASALQAKVEQLWGDLQNVRDFTLRRDPQGVASALAGFLADVAQAERLREVRALTGFTRLDAPDPEDPDLVTRAPLARDRPSWVPASEVRGEGMMPRGPWAAWCRWPSPNR